MSSGSKTFQRVLEAVIMDRPDSHRRVDIRPTAWRLDHVGKIDSASRREDVAIAVQGKRSMGRRERARHRCFGEVTASGVGNAMVARSTERSYIGLIKKLSIG